MTILTAPWGSVRPILTVILNLAIDIATLTAQVLPTHKLRCDLPQQHSQGESTWRGWHTV
jgi:hypothetical protein